MSYYIWNPNSGAPTVKHIRKIDAIDEAQRLAKRHRGEEFMVLKWELTVKESMRPTFGDLEIGDKFKHEDRTLIKTDTLDYLDEFGNYRQHNSVRIHPPDVAGRYSCFKDSTPVEKC